MSVTRKFQTTFSRPRNPSIVAIVLLVLVSFSWPPVNTETAKVCASYTLATGLWENDVILVDDGPCYDPFQLYDIADLTFDVNCTDVCGDCLGSKRSFSDEFNPSEGLGKRANECAYYFSPPTDATDFSPMPSCPHLQNVSNCAGNLGGFNAASEEFFCTYAAQQGVSVDSDCFKTYQLYACSLIDVEFNKLVFENELDINMLSVSAGSLVPLGKQQGTIATGPFCPSLCENDIYTSSQCGLMGASTCEASWDTCERNYIYGDGDRVSIDNDDGSRALCAIPCENGVSDCPAGLTCYEFTYSGGSSANAAGRSTGPKFLWDLFGSWDLPGILP